MRLSEQLGRTVKVTSDASCAALAESRVGAGRGVDDLIMITLGTGIGGGVIAEGRLLGRHGYLGEFGHMMIDPDGPVCPCGKRGCWERYASGSAIALEAKRLAIYEGRLGRLRCRWISGRDHLEHIVAAAIDGDEDAIRVLGHFAHWMAVGLGSLTMAFDPAMFVIGGGLSRAAPVYEDVLRERFAEAVYASDLRPAGARFRRARRTCRRRGRRLLRDLTTVTPWHRPDPHLAFRSVRVARSAGPRRSPARPRRPPIPCVEECLPGSGGTGLEEVLDLGSELRGQVGDIADTVPAWLPRRQADQLGVLAGLVLHVQHTDRPGFDPHTRVHRVVEEHEGVERGPRPHRGSRAEKHSPPDTSWP